MSFCRMLEMLNRAKTVFYITLVFVCGCILTYIMPFDKLFGISFRADDDIQDDLSIVPGSEGIGHTHPTQPPVSKAVENELRSKPESASPKVSPERCSNEQRKANMREACTRHKPVLDKYYTEVKNTYTHIFVDDRHKVLFCVVPKAGCSSWKTVMAIQSGKATEKTLKGHWNWVHKPAAAKSLGLRRLREDSIEEIRWKLANYTKVMVARNPLSRLFSAYMDKFVFFYQSYGKKIYMARLKRYFNDLPTIGGETFVSFAQFAEAMAASFQGSVGYLSKAKMDEHWRPIHKLCFPCHIQYDYIGKTETVSEDAGAILKLFNATKLPLVHVVSGDSVHQTNIFNVSKMSAKEAYAKVPREITEKLINAYKIDLDLLGYGMDERPTCGYSSGDSTCC